MIGARFRLTVIGAGAMAVVAAWPALAQPVRVGLDQEATIGEVGVACTGVGQTKNDPKWQAYPVRVEFAGPSGEYLADEILSIADSHGRAVAAIACEGPWILLKLAPGQRYVLTARVADTGALTKDATITVPDHGQARVVLTFADHPKP